MDLRYEHIITGRTESLFAEDIRTNEGALREALSGKRIAVVGAAGSIGSAVVKTLLRFAPGALALIDLSENNLVELVRDLRSTDGLRLPAEFATLPIGLGSVEFARYFAETKPFDYFLNLSAIKHVRTERDVYCLVRMIDTNVLFLHEFLSRNPYRFKKVFSVSSDKATNPANLMGATKMIMEKALLARSDVQPFSTARFANVAFSDGSLPFGFLQRIAKRQPLSAPSDVRRYFISHQEAGELCVLSCGLGENRDVFFPNLAQGLDEKTFADIARDLLAELGYTPVECGSEAEAKALSGKRQAPSAERRAESAKGQAESAESEAEGAERRAQSGERFALPASRLAQGWPCYFFKSDTTGEKEFEEFFAAGERLVLDRFKRVGVVRDTEDGGRRTEDGGRKTEDGRRKTEDGGRKTEDGGREAEDGRQRAEDGRGERGEGRGSGGRPPSLGFGVAQAGGGPISHLQSPISNASLKVAIHAFLNFAREAKADPTITKADYVREIQKLVPTLQHQETGRNLDQKM